MRFIALFVLLILLGCDCFAQTEADTEVLEMAARIEERVAKLRELPVKQSVGKGIYSRDQLLDFILGSFDEELPDEKAEAWEASLKLFGMIPPDMEMKQTLVDFLVSQVGGFYDPETKTLNCISSKLAFLQHIIMAHEILHSLQDQYVDLEEYYKTVEFNDDLLGARQCVIEGEAQRMTALYASAYPMEMAEDMADAKAEDVALFALEQFAAQAGAPPYFMETMTFPYLGGDKFIRAAMDEGGWDMVNALYKSPPQSTEQIIHPEKFFGFRDEPVKIVLPDVSAELGEGWEMITENTMGEFQVSVLIKLTADPIRAMRASAGWDGDTYAVYANGESGRKLMAWAVTFDTEKDAAEFFEAESKGLRLKYEARRAESEGGGHAVIGPGIEEREGVAVFLAGDGSMAVMEMRGKDVLVLDNLPGDAGMYGRVREAAWKFEKDKFDFKSLRPKPYADVSAAEAAETEAAEADCGQDGE